MHYDDMLPVDDDMAVFDEETLMNFQVLLKVEQGNEFGAPFVITLPKKVSGDEFYSAILHYLRFVSTRVQ